MIERSRVRIPAGTAGEFSSPGSTFCADSYFGIRSTPALTQKHVEDPTQKVFWNPELVMFVESNLLTMGLALDHCTVPPFDF